MNDGLNLDQDESNQSRFFQQSAEFRFLQHEPYSMTSSICLLDDSQQKNEVEKVSQQPIRKKHRITKNHYHKKPKADVFYEDQEVSTEKYMHNAFNTMEPYDSISQMISLPENNSPKTNESEFFEKASCKSSLNNIFYSVFRKNYCKKTQTSNKNFIKFLIPKFLEKVFSIPAGDSQWRSFNKKFCIGRYSRKMLSQLFSGEDEFGFKSKNIKVLYEMLKDRNFYMRHLYHSNYTKIQKNLKQYLLAAKVFSLRCISPQLLDRVKTK